MIYTLKNHSLTVLISDKGAELFSVRGTNGCEYLWQGDAKYWDERAPLLFPICGRLFGGKYTLRGKDYEMGLHGFARHLVFAADTVSDDFIRFTLSENEETLAVYPFKFTLTVEYKLTENQLLGNIYVKNDGEDIMPFTLGLHPGFNVPLGEGDFEDYFIEFTEPCNPDRIVLSDTCFLTGKNEAFYLENGNRIPLCHSLFDNDGIFLARNSHEICLRSDKSYRYVRFAAEGFPYVGFWHATKTDAPYVCIEPWYGMPSYDGEIDDLYKKRDMFRISSGEEKKFLYSLIFG